MKVINLFGGPNTGKTASSLGLAYYMKIKGYNVQLAGEYAADMVHENRSNILDDQLYILAKQNRRLLRLEPTTDWVINDSPLLFGKVYMRPDDPNREALETVIDSHFNYYENINFYFPRNYTFKYQTAGRTQASHEEAAAVDAKIEAILPADTYRLKLSQDSVDQLLACLGLPGKKPLFINLAS